MRRSPAVRSGAVPVTAQAATRAAHVATASILSREGLTVRLAQFGWPQGSGPVKMCIARPGLKASILGVQSAKALERSQRSCSQGMAIASMDPFNH